MIASPILDKPNLELSNYYNRHGDNPLHYEPKQRFLLKIFIFSK